MSQPYFAPETTLLLDQLEVFKTRREHFAVVVDEYGDFRGIVTLEDIILLRARKPVTRRWMAT